MMHRALRALVTALLVAVAAAACSDSTGPESLIEDNGLSRDINQLVPDTLIAILDSLGLPIHRGGRPPSIEGVYLATPVRLVSSNVPGDPAPGTRFADVYLEYSDQNNTSLTVTTDYVSAGIEFGEGLGSFIVGDGGNFTVFARTTTTVHGDTAHGLWVYSGTIEEGGIQGLYLAGFVLDNFGSPHFIPNGTGRVFRDQTGFSDRVEGMPGANLELQGHHLQHRHRPAPTVASPLHGAGSG